MLSSTVLALAGLLAACNPPSPDSPAGAEGAPKAAEPQVSAAQARITATQAVTAAQNGLNFVVSDAYSWISTQGCAACHRGGLPIFAGALSVKNGLSVNRSQLDWLGTKVAAEQTQWGDNFWRHDPGYELRFSKGSFEIWGLAGYVAYSGNTSYMNQMKSAFDWIIRETSAGSAGAQSYTNIGSGYVYNSGWTVPNHWSYTFPSDGKAFAGQNRRFVPGDYQSPPVTYNWPQPTGLVVAALSLWLNANQGLLAADRTYYTNYRNELADAIEGGYVRSSGGWTLQELFYGLNALIAAGRTPALNANAAAMRDEILSRKIAGNAGWADPVVGYGSTSAGATGEALYALCQAGVRLDQNQAVNDAINWLASIQNANGSWSYGAYTVDVPTSYALLGLSCYGVLNIAVTLSNVSPADADVTKAKLSPGIAGTQTVTFRVNVANQGYVTNSFSFSASGGVAGTTFSFSPSSITVNANSSAFTTVTATFPANLTAGIQVPISVVTSYVAAGGSTSTTNTQLVNIGSVVDPGAGALATTTSFTAGSGATIQVGQTLTLTAKAVGSNGTQVSGGSMTFFVGGQAIGTVAPSGNVFTTTWTVPSNITGNASIGANFSGAVVSGTSYAASSGSGTITVTLPPAPPAPTVTAPGSVSSPAGGNVNVTITGTAQAGSTVTVKEGAANLGSTTADAAGNYTITISLPPGAHPVISIATNAGGNSPNSTTVNISVIPPAPTVGSPANNLVTATQSQTFSGTGVPGATISIKEGATVLGTATVDAAGNYSVTLTLTQALHSISVFQTAGGVTSGSSTNLTVGILPGAPTISSPTANANLPNGANTVTGIALAGSTVTIRANGVSVGSGTANAMTGAYSVVATLPYGALTITAVATNGAGTSADSAGVNVLVDPAAPNVTSPNANIDLIGTLTYSGTAVGGATIDIYDNGAKVRTITADAAGNFSTTFTLSLGTHAMRATQTVNSRTSAYSPLRSVVVHADQDGDGVYDENDNCVSTYNPDQANHDNDGIGDVCDYAPGVADPTNNSTNDVDVAWTTDPSAEVDNRLNPLYGGASRLSYIKVPAATFANRRTATVVDTGATAGNIEVWGKKLVSSAAIEKLSNYDAQIGASHGVAVPGGLDVGITVRRGIVRDSNNQVVNYDPAKRTGTLSVKVKEADGSWTHLPNCLSGAKAADGRCSIVSEAWLTREGTSVSLGYLIEFQMKNF